MKPTFGLACAAALIAAAGLALTSGCNAMKTTAPPSPPTDAGTIVYELDNGMKVLIREDHFAPVVALQVWVEVGGADERDTEAGIAHVHEHMLFKGTKNRGVGEIATEIESSG